jgi:hypothetical protein
MVTLAQAAVTEVPAPSQPPTSVATASPEDPMNIGDIGV